jgi:hypothetical protein
LPFDGCDFYEFWPSAPVPLPRAQLGFWTRLSWSVRLFPSGFRFLRAAQIEAPEPHATRLLRAARVLIEAEESWVQGTYRTSDGGRCAIGALRAAAQGQYGQGAAVEAHGFLLAVARWRGFSTVEGMNDKSTHPEILAAFDAAIASAQGR